MPFRRMGLFTLVVKDYDEAIAYYCDVLGFQLLEDSPRGEGKRWVVVAPNKDDKCCNILLARADNKDQENAIGYQTGGRVGFFLYTDDFQTDYEIMKSKGVIFCEEPRHEEYGSVVVFADIYGNKWDLLQLAS